MPRSRKPDTLTSRKRASRACLSCQTRKVRCDAVFRDNTCTNCLLDHQECIMMAHTTKRKTSSKKALQITHQPRGPENKKHVLKKHSPLPTEDIPVDIIKARSENEIKGNIQDEELFCTRSAKKPHEGLSMTPEMGFYPIFQTPASKLDHLHLNQSSENLCDGHVIYSFLPFLHADLSQLSENSVRFLDMQGCFKVPGTQALNEFIQAYFQHVHPILPLLDESGFLKMYTRRITSQCMSLFVFQAMLFASSCFLSFGTIQKLGFTSLWHARTSYYRRAKLLFDFGVDLKPTPNAQGALLLSYNTSMQSCKRDNSLWLSTAIRLAREAGAPQYHCIQLQGSDSQRELGKLWWCCRVQDRILSIGLRRRPFIPSSGFNFSEEAFADEFYDEISDSSSDNTGFPVVENDDRVAFDQESLGVACTVSRLDQRTHIMDNFEVPEKLEGVQKFHREPGNQAQHFFLRELRYNPLQDIADIDKLPSYVDPLDLELDNEKFRSIYIDGCGLDENIS